MIRHSTCHDHPEFADDNYRLKLSSLTHLDAEVCQSSGIRIRQSAIDEWYGVRSRHPYEFAPRIILQKDPGRLSWFLGLMFSLDRNGESLSQEHCAQELLRRFEKQDCRPVATPAIVEAKDEDLGEKVDQH